MPEKNEPQIGATKREIVMAARATIELFGEDAVRKTAERLAELETDGEAKSAEFWKLLLEEVKRLEDLRQRY